ncbi:MAG: hypothetical protein DRO88_00955 [Promethearchaeia archaeon]|nr:MAG: hypothetical protein DRO88_00955 [Candidatus Lokiarchaeia archaeon]
MTVTIKDVLQLSLFSDAIILTGKNGLNRKISRINFMDCPLDDENDDETLTMPGDLFINSLYLVKDDPKMLEKWFDFYLEINCAGVILINEFFQDLPEKIKEKLDKNDFPVILIDKDIPYAEIIMKIMELILQEKTDTILEMQIDQLLNSDLPSKQTLEFASNINKSFRKNYVCIFLSPLTNESNLEETLKNIRKELSTNHKLQVAKYRSSLLVIINFDDRIIYDSAHLFIKKILLKHGLNFKMGISNIYQDKSAFANCIKEALSAFEYSQEINTNVIQYSDVDIYRLLLSINNPEKLKEYFQKYIVPLQSNHQSDLLETLEIFIEFDGDTKKTAKYFDQHENTIRYRISKAKKILNLEQNNLKFIEIVSIGIKVKSILEDLEET